MSRSKKTLIVVFAIIAVICICSILVSPDAAMQGWNDSYDPEVMQSLKDSFASLLKALGIGN